MKEKELKGMMKGLEGRKVDLEKNLVEVGEVAEQARMEVDEGWMKAYLQVKNQVRKRLGRGFAGGELQGLPLAGVQRSSGEFRGGCGDQSLRPVREDPVPGIVRLLVDLLSTQAQGFRYPPDPDIFQEADIRPGLVPREESPDTTGQDSF